MTRQSMIGWVWWVGVLFAITGCTDTGGGADDADAADPTDVALGDGPPTPDAAPDPDATPDPDAAPADAALPDLEPDLAPPPDLGPPECEPGERVCLDSELPARAACGPDGRWAVEQCADGEVCLGEGACVPDPATCVEDQRTCLAPDLPAVCEPGEGWIEASPCLAGWTCIDGRCRDPRCAASNAQRSYLGCEFMAVDLQNIAYSPVGGTPDSPLGLVLANADDVSARVWITTADGEPATLIGEVTVNPPIVAAGEMPITVHSELRRADGQLVEQGFDEAHSVDIPAGGMGIFLLPTHNATLAGVRPDAWRINTDRPVAAYQFGPYCCNFSFTNDASLLLPVSSLGTEYRYIGVPGWGQQDDEDPVNPGGGVTGLPATMTVVGTEPDTRVTVTLPPGASVERDIGGRFAINGQTVEFDLQPGEVADLLTTAPSGGNGRPIVGVDLSGARISSTAPVAVFSGHQCTFYPQDQSACDHLEEQLFPTDTWGNQFILTPVKLRTATPDFATETTFWKIIARDPRTRVRLSVPFGQLGASPPGSNGVPDCRTRLIDPETIELEAGEFCEFGTRAPLSAQSDRPIAVMGIISGQASTGFGLPGSAAGDPAIFLLPPDYQYRRDYAFLTPTTYFVDYVTVIAPADANLVLDGQPVDLGQAEPVPGSTRVFRHIEIDDGPHRIEGDQPFGIVVYAFDDWVSYAFTGGQNLIKR